MRDELKSYFVLAYALTWAFTIPFVIAWHTVLDQTCLMTFLFGMSRGSVLLAVVYHTSFNTAETIVFRCLPEPTAAQEFQVWVIGIALSWVLAVVLLTWLGRRRERYDTQA